MSLHPKPLQKLISFIEEDKATNTVVIHVGEHTSITDFMIITTGRSSRHIQAIASHAIEKMKAAGISVLSSSGKTSGDWVLVDFGDYILHVMGEETRNFYNLEALWQHPPKSH